MPPNLIQKGRRWARLEKQICLGKKKRELLLLAYTETWLVSAIGRLDDWMCSRYVAVNSPTLSWIAQLAKGCFWAPFQPCSVKIWGRWCVCSALLSPGEQEKLPPAWSHYHLGCYQEAWRSSGSSHKSRKDNCLKIIPYPHGSRQGLKRSKIKVGTVISSFFHPHSVLLKHWRVSFSSASLD